MIEPEYEDEEVRLVRKGRIFVDTDVKDLCDSDKSDCKDGEHIIEFIFDILGVEKEYIHLSVVNEHLDLIARTNEKEYVSHNDFDCPVKYKV